ncbi:MAG: LysR family transcriptional regulator [Cumulibacter sp.]
MVLKPRAWSGPGEALNIEEIRSFVTIVSAGSLGRAAPQLFVSRSALSRRIRDLENRLSVDLFDRTAKGMSLTAAGDRFLVHAERLVEAYDDLQRHATNLVAAPSRVRVGIGPAMNAWLRDRVMTTIRALRNNVDRTSTRVESRPDSTFAR